MPRAVWRNRSGLETAIHPGEACGTPGKGLRSAAVETALEKLSHFWRSRDGLGPLRCPGDAYAVLPKPASRPSRAEKKGARQCGAPRDHPRITDWGWWDGRWEGWACPGPPEE